MPNFPPAVSTGYTQDERVTPDGTDSDRHGFPIEGEEEPRYIEGGESKIPTALALEEMEDETYALIQSDDNSNITRGTSRFRDAMTGVVDAAGVGLVEFPPVRDGYYWMVERYVMKGAGAGAIPGRVYVGEVADANLVDGTTDATLDVGDQIQPIYVPSGRQLRFTISAATVGSAFTVTIQGKRYLN